MSRLTVEQLVGTEHRLGREGIGGFEHVNWVADVESLCDKGLILRERTGRSRLHF
jgi:hypothetical protein